MARPISALLRRYPGRALLLIIPIVIITALVIGEVAGWPFLRTATERFISNRIERTIKIDSPFEIRFIGGIRIKADGVWVSAPPGFDVPYFIDAANVVLKLRYSDLLSVKRDKTAPVRIKTLHIGEGDVFFIRKENGKATWNFDDDDDESLRPFPVIDNLLLQNGLAIVKDPETESDFKIAFDTRKTSKKGEATSKVELQGKFRDIPIKAELLNEGFLPIGSKNNAEANLEPVNSTGWVDYGGVRVDFNGTVSDILGAKNIKGTLSVTGPSLSIFGLLVSTLLPATAPFKLQGEIKKSDNVWQTDIHSAHIGDSDLSGSFKYDPRPDIPKLEGVLKGKRFFLADLAPVFGAGSDGSDKSPDRIFSNQPLDLPSLNRMNADVSIDLDYVQLGSAFSRPIAPLKADLNLNKGKLSLAKLSANTADGVISGVISIDARKATEEKKSTGKNAAKESKSVLPEWRVELQVKRINLEKWLQVSKDRKQTAAREGAEEIPPAYVTGLLNGKANLAGRGDTTADLLGSMDGEIALDIKKGTLSHLVIEALGLDLAQALGVMIEGDHAVPMHCAVMNLNVNNGIAKPTVALVDTPVTLVLADGKINLAKESLDLRLIAKPKNVSPFTVRSPILVTGTFVNPDVSIDKVKVTAKVLGAVALAFINPLAAILPFIDTGEETTESPCRKALAEFNEAKAKENHSKTPEKNSGTNPVVGTDKNTDKANGASAANKTPTKSIPFVH